MTEPVEREAERARAAMLAFPSENRIGSARFGWRLAWWMLKEQPRLYLSCLLASLVVAAIQIADWIHRDGDVMHVTLDRRLLTLGLTLLHQAVVLPVAYAAFQRLYFGSNKDSWLWQSACWREPRFNVLLLGISLCNMLPNLIATSIQASGIFSQLVAGAATLLTSILGLIIYFYTTKAQFLAPALVLRDPQADLSTALIRSNGHFWDLTLGQIFVFLPIAILVIACHFLLAPKMMSLAMAGYLPATRPIGYFIAYTYVFGGLLNPHVYIAQAAVISAFYPYRPSPADMF